MRSPFQLLTKGWPRRLLVSESAFEDLRHVTHQILAGVGFFPRWGKIRFMKSLGASLDIHLKTVPTPRAALLVVHGDEGKLVGGVDESGTWQFVDAGWFGRFDSNVDVLAFGCETAGFFNFYRLNRRCANFIGISEKVRFFRGSAATRRAEKKLLGRIGYLFANGLTLNAQAIDVLTSEYVETMRELRTNSRRPSDGARAALVEFERQIQGLRHFKGEGAE